MDMRANFLASLSRAKDPDDWNFGFFTDLRRLDIVSKDRIKLRWSGLVIVDAVQSDAEEIHGIEEASSWREH